MESYANRKALIVDDEEGIREILGDILEDFGLSVVFAEHGQAALEKIKSHQFDIIFSDITMPVMGGIELIENLKLLEIEQPFLVLVSGVVGRRAAPDKKFTDLADAILPKPFDDIVIRNILEKL